MLNMSFIPNIFIILRVDLEYVLAASVVLFPVAVCLQNPLTAYEATLTQTYDVLCKDNVTFCP